MPKLFLLLSLFPLIANARYQVTDLVKTGSVQGEILKFGLDPSLVALSEKFTAALKKTEIMRDLQPKMKPGQPMPYDPRFGISEAEYARLGQGLKNMKLVASGQKTELIFEKDKNTLMIKGTICSALKQGVKIDLATNKLSTLGESISNPSYFENRTTPVAPADGYSWSTRTRTGAGKMEFALAYRLDPKNCMLSYDVSDGTLREAEMIQYPCSPASGPKDGALDLISQLGTNAPGSPVVASSPKAGAPAPPPKPVVVVTGDAPTSCRASLGRYPIVPPKMFTLCKQANSLSASAINEYTLIYKGGLAEDLLVELLKVNSQSQLDCAIQIARKFDGTMTTQYFKETCL